MSNQIKDFDFTATDTGRVKSLVIDIENRMSGLNSHTNDDCVACRDFALLKTIKFILIREHQIRLELESELAKMRPLVMDQFVIREANYLASNLANMVKRDTYGPKCQECGCPYPHETEIINKAAFILEGLSKSK